MTGEELKDWTNSCLEELEEKQKKLKTEFGLGDLDSYFLDSEQGLLIFEKDGKQVCSFQVVPIGSLVPDRENWLWGWANKSLSDCMRESAEELKELRKDTGFGIFEIESFKADKSLAQELSALAVHFLGADGFYRIISDQSILYLTLSKGDTLEQQQ